jgi:molybdopterin-guanine dinucleotide biosynthesis protein A
MIKRLSVLLAPVAESITVVAERDRKYEDLGLPTIPDEVPGLGPLGGLITALTHRQANASGWLLLCACDWAEIRTSWVEELVKAADDEVDAVAFRDDRWQPLFALYHTRLLPEAARHVRRQSRRMSGLLETVASRALPPPPEWHMNWQINSQLDRARYIDSLEARRGRLPTVPYSSSDPR